MVSIETQTTITSLVLFVTSDAMNIIINNTFYYCVCRKVNSAIINKKTRAKLTVKKQEVSSNIRKMYFVPEFWMLSKVVVNLATCIIILVVAGM